MGKLSDKDWMAKQITSARSREGLHFLAKVIQEAKEDEEEFTKDEEAMSKLKELWLKRMSEIKQRREG